MRDFREVLRMAGWRGCEGVEARKPVRRYWVRIACDRVLVECLPLFATRQSW